jgi:predicted transcriptional regulator of viral defense system
MTRSLAPLEARLILALEWDKKNFISAAEARRILAVSPEHARVLLHRLVRKGWLAPVVPGIYELIPAERGEAAFVDTNPLALGSVLVEPYAFSYATAAFFYGLTTQASATVYLQTTTGKTRTIWAREKGYRVIAVPEQLFFGITKVNAYGSQVRMTEPEKAILDCLQQPETAGDIPEIAAMLWQGKGRLDWKKLVDYAGQFQSQMLAARLGYLLDYLEIPLPGAERARLLAQVSKSFGYLGRPGKWGKGGRHHPEWQIVANIPEAELQAEIQIS